MFKNLLNTTPKQLFKQIKINSKIKYYIPLMSRPLYRIADNDKIMNNYSKYLIDNLEFENAKYKEAYTIDNQISKLKNDYIFSVNNANICVPDGDGAHLFIGIVLRSIKYGTLIDLFINNGSLIYFSDIVLFSTMYIGIPYAAYCVICYSFESDFNNIENKIKKLETSKKEFVKKMQTNKNIKKSQTNLTLGDYSDFHD